MSNMMLHPYHLVDDSPWPMISSIFALGLTSGFIMWFYTNSSLLMWFNLVNLILLSGQWWRDVAREATLLGHHTSAVEGGLRWGMILFIISEVFFFMSFFWAFFNSSMAVNIELGTQWPPMGILPLDPLGVPALNTIVLLSSGVSVTVAHHALMAGKHSSSVMALAVTVSLGVYFTGLQAMEYLEASFSLADSVYGSTFYVATGFHGLHVIIGSLFLMVSLMRLSAGGLSPSHHFGFEAAAWYWHFVDVVWLFLFMVVYWWSTL